MTKVIKQTCVSSDKQSKKEVLYKPYEGKRKEWVAMVQNLIEKNSNEKLTSALNRISQAEEIPIKWNKISKPKFMNFMKHVMKNKEDCVQDEQLWELVSKDLKEKIIAKSKKDKIELQKEITAKEKKIPSPAIEAKPVVKATPAETVVKAAAVKPAVKAAAVKPAVKASAVKPAVKAAVVKPAVKAVAVKPSVKATAAMKKSPAEPAMLPKSQNNSQGKQTEWATIIKNLVQTNTNEELTSALQKISNAKNIPSVKKWEEIRKAKFENFLNNIPGYEVNPIIDEQLRILISKARQEQQIKEKDEKYLSKGYTAKPIQNERNSAWITLFKNLVEQQAVDDGEELPSDAFQRIIQNGEIPKIFNGVQKSVFQKFLKNKLDLEVNPKIADQLWDLISKALEEQRASKAKILANKKPPNTANKVKATKRKIGIENEKPADNGTGMKRMREEVETKSGDGESCDPVDGTTIVCEGAQQPTKIKWNSIGKTILLAQDAKEMSLKKFQKKVVAEYLKRVGNAGSDESVEDLWCKCQSKLSKNSKFQIDADKIKLVS
ncbi:hypothetical protein DAPPUDRAFT_304944 [Daphnia pulex]|uniref:Cell growth-regulating nucleolar protein-like winged helix domain-containing protein n=1 Tax=Daphnia pulex TaxID=6669 RepID=E9GMR5_DAPPU|nr:hypothetical protein DAPPUDRAFT_304944 [Daphnia pulex]|eukprot:EFX79140.1 hypothetical protein DAPPUDRAFT_304944 [Daphnia pulex]